MVGAFATGCASHVSRARQTLAERLTIGEHKERADAAYNAQDFAAAARALDEAAALALLDRGAAYYNAACCHALAGDRDRAFAALGEAFDRGFGEPATLDQDADLAALRLDARWPAAVARAEANLAAYLATASGELYQIYIDDQADRAGDVTAIDWSVVAPRDEARRGRVLAMIAEETLASAADFFHAAMVLQHGHDAEAFATAARLADRAVSLDPSFDQARWLAAAATDRGLRTLGKLQRYGTQFFVDAAGTWSLQPIDPSVTDQERVEHAVPPLVEAHRRVARMNRKR